MHSLASCKFPTWSLCLFYFFLSACGGQSEARLDLFSLKLKKSNGQEFQFQVGSSDKATVLLFLSPECPACQNYSLTLNQLYDRYKSMDIHFYGIFSGNGFDENEIADFAKTYKIEFDLLLDPEKKTAKLFKAQVTPEAFILDASGKVIYQGAVDNWLYAAGKKRALITEHYLQDALLAVVSGEKIKISLTQAKGCLLE